ncbi:elongator complex protein 5 [Paramormyrops kingsleyae]|uniref:Elongator complex protein 5 n=1 Tax=Paramormyrops kingsleyae TaxID=1676925 RepID=A0A3B3RA31_9TELE|nr:elongator complex protein 5 [Paramormyrops kingsleyae]
MLLDVIQGTENGGFVIIQDTVECCGRQLLQSCIAAALHREEDVHVLAFEVCEEDVRLRLDRKCEQRLCVHNGYTDPLGWSEHPLFTVHQFISEELNVHLSGSEESKPATLVIDSLSWILRHHPPAVVCQRLQELRRGGALRRVVALLHCDLHQQGIVGSLCHLATAVISVVPGDRGQQAVAKTTRRTKSGKVTHEEEYFSVKEDLTVTVESRPSHHGRPQTEEDEREVDPAANLTFNLRLSEGEKEAKEKLSLPFVFSAEKKSALLQPRPGSGRIVYDPDASDDFDPEDPDDDLAV